VAIVPARLGSTRLPRKMLLAETGRYLFQHTAENAARCPAIARVVVATDSDEILAAARERGLEALATSPAHPSGTDRVHEALQALLAAGEAVDVVVGVQGDEPELEPADLARLVAAFGDPDVSIATLCAPLEPGAEAATNVVKVVRDARGDALYFSRAPIPDRSHARAGAAPAPALRHVGVYAFRPSALARFAELPPGALEAAESLEQLRWLEAGERMRVVDAARAPAGIDTAEEYARFVARARARAEQPGDAAPPLGVGNERDPWRAGA
jgi:3-deoxy-manno-octulosonate cytidylyltransferase (CMP-KDO synthetase)